MKKELFTDFDSRQYMKARDFEIFYYKDTDLKQVSPHSHDYYEFYFFLEGDVTYEIEGKSFRLGSGDYMLIPPGISHHPVFQSTEVPYRRFVLWIGKSFYEQLLSYSPDFSYGFDHVIRDHQYRFHLDYLLSQEIQGKLLDLLEEANTTRSFGDLNAHLMAASLLVSINRLTYDSLNQITPSYENALYLNVCDYINNHLDEDLTLDTLAAFFFVSKYHISHVFKDNMGISPHQYITKKRLQASKNTILTGVPFTVICHQYGFHDYTSYYRAFKKEFGLSPTEFREQRKLPEDFEYWTDYSQNE